ncbi:MAG: TlpA family protein disulfide reductase [Burkholderiales bacterium]|nr:TlpA family protein disulfide reductase [Burkholderiales bacterium]
MRHAAPSLSRRHCLLAAGGLWSGQLARPAQAQGRAVETGDSAPWLDLPATDGAPALAPGPWRATWLDFWASWCGPCRQSFPWMNELHDRLGSAGLRVVAISLDTQVQDAMAFLQQVPARFALAFDTGAISGRAFGVKAMPSSYLIGADRRVLWVHRGFRRDDRSALERRIQAALVVARPAAAPRPTVAAG